MNASQTVSLETVKIDEMGKGRDLPIPCPRDNICYKRIEVMPRVSAWHNPLSPGFCSEGKLQHCRCGRLHGPSLVPATWLLIMSTPKDVAR